MKLKGGADPGTLPPKLASTSADFTSAAVAILGSYRIPSMLVAGAAYGGVFALPLSIGDEMVKQLAKRTYILIGLGTVVSALFTTIVATLAIDKLSLKEAGAAVLAPNLNGFLAANLEIEWAAVRVHFLLGLMGFAVMCGMRAWISLSCPQFGRVGLGIIISALSFMWAIINECLGDCGYGFVQLMGDYLRAIWKKAIHGKWRYILAMVVTTAAFSYTAWAYVHVYQYFMRMKAL